MSSRPLPNKVPRHRWQALRPYLTGFMLVLAILFLNSISSSVNGQSANLDQGANEKVTTPVSPVSWVNGNLNSNQAHFLEGYSIPYRAILGDLVVGKTYTLVIGFDQRDGSKHALDYITHFQRLESHAIFGHPAETVDPLLDIAGFPASYFTTTDVFTIPAPSVTGSPVAGQPATSFNALPAGEQVMTGYNVDLLSVVYSSSGSLTDAHSETVVNITFTALKETAVLAWGGHIASQPDWGKGESASAISGSPYHMRLKNWIIDDVEVSIGNQDRSLKTDAVFIPPKCDVTGPHSGCVENSSLSFTSTVDDENGLTYLWSIIGANTAQAKIVDNTAANIQVVPIGSAFLTGSFALQLIVTRDGLKDTCYLDSHTTPGVNVVITNVNVSAGSDQEIDHLSTANLNAVASDGTEPYSYKWSPVTGLSDPNIANPVFTPPGTGIFQFIVTATDANGCVGKDTVVITVKEHPKPPCGITGPDPVCPGSTNTYKGPAPADVGSYLWSVTGDASIVGPTDRDSVVIKADNKCGSYTIKVVVTTPDGKVKDSCFKTVQVKDEIKPVLHGTADDANITCAKDKPAVPNITATDNCQAEIEVKYSQVTEDSTCVNKFRIVRKWWATDVCGNTSDTLKQVITVNDNVKPVITADFPKEVNVQCLKDAPAPPAPTATDNCDGTLKPVYTEEGSGTACDSTVTRKWVFTDACGNSDYVTQVIHAKDNTKPSISGNVSDKTVVCAKDVPAPPSVTSTDNCDLYPYIKYWQVTKDSSCPNRFKLVRKWYAVDDCGNKSDTLTQIITVYDDVKPVITANFTKEVWIQCVKDIPAAPTPTATDNCGGDVKTIFTCSGYGNACDSTINRKWVFLDACWNKDSVTQVIHIKDNTKPGLTGSVYDKTVACAKDVPAPPTVTATDNCDPYPYLKFTEVKKDSTCVNRFKIYRKWWAKDKCGNVSDTLRQTITVYDNIAPTVTYKPADKNVTCGNDRSFGTPTFADNCGCTPKVTYEDKQSGYTCPITYTRTWTATDDCGNYVKTQQSVTVGCCDKQCTLTQGFYGNVNGLACTPGGGKVTATQIMSAAVDAQDGDSVIFGLKATGKFFTLFLSDVTNGNIFKMMPGGGTPAALKGYATYSKTATWPNIPVNISGTNYGKINNNLLAQTMTLFFNMNLSTTLGAFPIVNDTLFTSKLPTCGSTIPSNTIDKYILAKNVVTYLQNTGQASIQGLFNLANKYLGGQTVSGVSASDVNNSIDAINRGFDQCAVLFRWGTNSYAPLVQTGGTMNADVTVYKQTVSNESGELKVKVFPNPYTDKLIFRFTAPVSGRTVLEMFNVQGQRLDAVDKGMVDKGSTHTIEYEVKEAFRGPLIYKLNVGPLNASGKVISFK